MSCKKHKHTKKNTHDKKKISEIQIGVLVGEVLEREKSVIQRIAEKIEKKCFD